MRNCPKRKPRKLNETDQLQFVEIEKLEFRRKFMSRKKAIFLYLLGTLGQIWMICIIVFILRNLGMDVDYTMPMGLVAIVICGV